jgi:tripartite-type tricarboxylate transporter receptor subunit TctC
MANGQRGIFPAALALAAALALQTPATAQQLDTSKPIRLIVALSAGGGTDVTARLIAQQMTQNMGMTVLVENKPGGNFIPAGKEVLNSPPDGHTLYFISSSSLITQAVHKEYPFDLMKFVPVSEVSTGPLIMVARNGLGVKSVKELVALAKAKPGTLKFGAGGGTGSSLGLATVLLQALADINITIVPYRGAGPALNDLLGDHIDAMVDAMPVSSVQAKEGKVTALAVTGTKRASTLPDVPTMQELGYKEFVVTGWYGILAGPGTPPAIVQKLRDEAAKAVAQPEVVQTLAQQGMEPRGTQPAEFTKYMESEMAFYKKIIKDANVPLQ